MRRVQTGENIITPSFKGVCMDLYIATRSDAPHLLKVGRSSNAHSRCRQLQSGHCFSIHVIAIFREMGACERPVHRALRDFRLGTSEWFYVDMLTAVEAIQDAEPQVTRPRLRNNERTAYRNKVRGNTIKSTRYPHLNESA